MTFKFGNWDLTKGHVDYVDSWPLMASPGTPMMIIAIYLLFILKWGPRYMFKKAPFGLHNVLVVYNAAQVLFSMFLAYKCITFNIRNGIFSKSCELQDKKTERELMSCIWWYFIAKITELLDTVFFILRKKDSQVSFLHNYHHSIMMFGTWVYMKYSPSSYLVFLGSLNSCVHVIMYTYYGIAAMGPKYKKYIWWKKYTTKLQLAQFCTMLVFLFMNYGRTKCSHSEWTDYFSILNVFIFLGLFLNFYIKSYKFNFNLKTATTFKETKPQNSFDDAKSRCFEDTLTKREVISDELRVR